MNAETKAKNKTLAIEKFWKNINKTDFCWNWIGVLDKSGLPSIRSGDSEISPRRLSLELDGQIISSSDHAQPLICQNKLCVNPKHLVIGDANRFWAKVQKLSEVNGGCWVWTAAHDKDMYGLFRICENGKKIQMRAHIYSWQLYTGRPVPPSGQICHKCDHPYCVNPDHLFLGSTQDNTQDKVEKGRQSKGENHGSAKLTELQVREIRILSTQGKRRIELSKLYNVSSACISGIALYKEWKHIK